MKHLAGNHRSRWRDFLTTDGEKRYRDRESELQIVQLARHFAGEAWQTLSIAPGKSEDYNAAMRAKHGDWS